MKTLRVKTLLISLLIVLVSCSKESDTDPPSDNSGFSIPELYIVGDATMSGWNIADPVEISKKPDQTNIYEYQGNLVEGELKFSTFKGDWCDGSWLNAPAENSTLDGGSFIVTNGCDGPDNKWIVDQGEEGNYIITIDGDTKKISFAKDNSTADLPDIPVNPYLAPLYWSAYEYCYTNDTYIPESTWEANIDWVEENLLPYGYDMVAIDGWGDYGDNTENLYGYRISHTTQWQHDYAYWSNYLQEKGMKLGMYFNPLWVSTSAADAGAKIEGTNIPLSSIIDKTEETLWFTWVQVGNPGAEEYVKGYVKHFADMGIDFLRVDFLSWFETGYDKNLGNVGPSRSQNDYIIALKWIREACDENHVFLSLVMPNLTNEAEVEQVYGHMIRVADDTAEGGWSRFSESNRGERFASWSQYSNPFDGLIYWSYISGSEKIILDADFLRMNTFASDDERKSVISLSVLAGSPITVADQYNTGDDYLWLYQNEDLLALNREGFVAKPLSNDPLNPESLVWKGEKESGDWIIGLFNRSSDPQTKNINLSNLGISGDYTIKELWTKEMIPFENELTIQLPVNGSVVLELSRTN